MYAEKNRPSVMRVINVKAENCEEHNMKRAKHVKYILRPDATDDSLILYHMVEATDVDTFGLFAKAAGRNTGRPIKHIVISYGGNEHGDIQKFREITEEIAALWPDYQSIAAIHTNIPSRPHAHILVDCFNISTRLKMSEGPNEFNNLIYQINKILRSYDVPELLQKERYTQNEVLKNPKGKQSIGADKQVKSEMVTNNATVENLPWITCDFQMNHYVSQQQLNDFELALKFIFPEMY